MEKHNTDNVLSIGDTDWIIEHHGKILSRAPSPGNGPDKEEVQMEWPGYFYLSHGHGLIDDVQMPLFVLAVFYAGLFAILGDNKRKEQ